MNLLVKVKNVFSIVGRNVVENRRHKEFVDALCNKKLRRHKMKRIQSKAKRKNTLISGNPGDEKNLHPGGCNFFFFNHFNFLNKIYIKSLFFVEKQRVLPFIVWTKKRRVAWINLLWKFALTANSTDWTSHYGIEIQSLTWFLHRRSQNLQPANTS